jgi:hypothetical protein
MYFWLFILNVKMFKSLKKESSILNYFAEIFYLITLCHEKEIITLWDSLFSQNVQNYIANYFETCNLYRFLNPTFDLVELKSTGQFKLWLFKLYKKKIDFIKKTYSNWCKFIYLDMGTEWKLFLFKSVRSSNSGFCKKFFQLKRIPVLVRPRQNSIS